MSKYILTENFLELYIDLTNFSNSDLYFVTNLEKLFLIKNIIKLKGHFIINKHSNYKTFLLDNIRVIRLPKYAALNLFSKLKLSFSDSRLPPLHNISFSSNIILYPNQKIICDHLEHTLLTRLSHSLVFVAQTGSGKTLLALDLISRLKVKTLIILPNLLLLNQWKSSLLDHLDLVDSDILLWYGKSSKKRKNLTIYNNTFKIILTTVHSSTKISPDILNQNNVFFTIFDEIHLYATNFFSDSFWFAQRYFNLGLTATPHKLNGFEKIYIQHLNKLSFSHHIVPDSSLSSFSGHVKIVKNHIKYPDILTDSGFVSIPLLINKICEDDVRNQIIIKYIILLYDSNPKHCIFIFSDRRLHLLNLANLLFNKRNDMNIVINSSDHDDIKVLIGGSKEDDINDAINNSRVIFTTYQYSSVGVNIQKMNTMILSTPRKNNLTQIIGRILRNGSDVSVIRQIIDIVDCKSILYSQLYERKKVYIENNFKLEYIDENKN